MKANYFRGTFCVLIPLILLICAVNCESKTEQKVVETNDGKVRGVRKTTLLKKIDYYSFKGIPYAKSPTGELRFKAPEPVEPWTPKILDASKHGPSCTQHFFLDLPNTPELSEDCLFVNVYVPADIKPDEKLAVLLHIHGGGYSLGSGNDDFNLGPDFLLEQRVIVATLNYRLGVFGFMSFGTPEYSGNMGLKDQQLALKWVHSNIGHFSGDNQRITLFGISAGGASTHFQLFSAESRKYFRNIISMSGTVDDYWALSTKSDHLDVAHQIAEDLGEPKQTLDELIAFFKTAPAKKLEKHGNLSGFMMRTCVPNMRPVLERRDAIRPFIVDLPSKIYEETNVDADAMFTLAKTEFITFFSESGGEIYDLKGLDRNFNLTLPFRDIDLPFDSEEYKRIASEIREFYFKGAAIDEKTLIQYIDLLSDINFAYGIDKSARQHAEKTNQKTFYARFSVDSKLSVMKSALGSKGVSGAAHGDDICYVFRCDMLKGVYDEIVSNPDDKHSKISLQTIDNLTKLYANFAKFGNPVHNGEPVKEFLPIQGNKVHFLDVTEDGLKPGLNPNRAANEMWARIEEQVYKIAAESAKTTREEL